MPLNSNKLITIKKLRPARSSNSQNKLMLVPSVLLEKRQTKLYLKIENKSLLFSVAN